MDPLEESASTRLAAVSRRFSFADGLIFSGGTLKTLRATEMVLGEGHDEDQLVRVVRRNSVRCI
jgi:hypothetical protein